VDEALALLLSPGFSTTEQVTELSGRGIGMDVVGSLVQALGGRIEAKTVAGAGTEFILVLPLTTAMHSVLMLRVGDFRYRGSFEPGGVGAARCSARPRTSLRGQNVAMWPDRPFPFWAGALLQQPARRPEALAARAVPVAVFRSAGRTACNAR